MKAYAATHVGNVRRNNEDDYYAPKGNEMFAIVADGMGGHNAGEVASKMAVDAVSSALRESEAVSEGALIHGVKRANHLIYEEGQRNPARRGMGTTVTAVWLDSAQALVAQVGDSRAYLLRNGALMQITSDHSLVNEMVSRGEITPEAALTHPHRNIITRTVGTSADVTPDIFPVPRAQGDIWLLCSDGLSNFVQSHEMAQILLSDGDWQAKVDALIQTALRRGGSDNITCVVLTDEEASV
ncbi:MAG: Stp1/IreP family PP2C-type Ser/Thr phosphatase [Christensenellales bacterium]|jgi:serine/threonine protein phosphatase PrpC